MMGSPDPRRIDGVDGADPLTNKVTIIRRPAWPDVDMDYLFAQVSVTVAIMDYGQNCNNILATIDPFAIECGLVRHDAPFTRVYTYMENTRQLAVAEVPCNAGGVGYADESRIGGVSGSTSPILLHFFGVAGSSCGTLLPTGRVRDRLDGVEMTRIDNGMLMILLCAYDLDCTSYETRGQLDNDDIFKCRLESIRLQAGPLMQPDGVSQRTVSKMTLVTEPRHDGTISNHTFILHRYHASTGVFDAVNMASACLLPGSAVQGLAQVAPGNIPLLNVEYPTGGFSVALQLNADSTLAGYGLLCTA